ncbi:hypothetical protein TSUD_213750 [Trifolium subterraneum]|uniref:Reverse transcriptase zinc-binding domain-containing protein n=1 Tax=Trifolium subterraneum TaxID=3900 RepID=A0A2Z6MZC0_TRISU|nr:hypothetical protein TSUD_213750 [Trifolium subterraneum]
MLTNRLFKARWVNGDGSKVKVMCDLWLRVDDGRWIGAPQIQGVDAKVILVIALLSEVQEDRLIWNEEKEILYSVRFGYRKLMEERSYRGGMRTPQQWGKIWKVQAPPEAKHLMWRICKDCLPTRMRLQNHYVQYQQECPLCLQVPKDDWHLLSECEGSKEAWNEVEFVSRQEIVK